MMAKNSIVEATRLLLQSSAKAYYCGLSEDAKEAVHQRFSAADMSGKGRISFHDFFDSTGSPTVPGFSWKGLFGFLDADNNGFLELDEFITLYYINKSGVFFCNTCGIPIITGGFSCTECPPPGGDSFDVCLSCYASPMTDFRHHHPRMSFVNLVASYHQSGSRHNSFNSVMPNNNSMKQPQAAQIYVPGSMGFKCDCCGTDIVTHNWYTCKECVSSFDLCLSCYDSCQSYFHHPHPYSSFQLRAEMAEANANHAPQRERGFTKLISSGMDLIAQLIELSVQAGMFSG